MVTRYLEPTLEAAMAFIARRHAGSIVMLNLLRLREIADYAQTPQLAPRTPISGAAAYRHYLDHTLPLLRATGGELLFRGSGGAFFIGPTDERWDVALLVRQASAESFLAFARHHEYLAGMGHRTAAAEDSRLLPLTEFAG